MALFRSYVCLLLLYMRNDRQTFRAERFNQGLVTLRKTMYYKDKLHNEILIVPELFLISLQRVVSISH